MKSVSVEEAVALIPNGASIMVGGFMGVGTPERLLDELVRQQKTGITLISNDASVPGKGVGKLFEGGQVSSMIGTHIGLNPKAQQQMLANQIKVDLIPQGTFVERIRAGGCGLGGVLTPTGVGTVVAEGKEVREIDGKRYVLERPLRANLAIVRAAVADIDGNLRFYRTARNFNPIMAMAADVTVAEVDKLVHRGAMDPDDVHLPGIFVKRVVEVREHLDVIEHRTTRTLVGRSGPSGASEA